MEGERVRVELIPFESRVGNRISAPREFAQHDQGAIREQSGISQLPQFICGSRPAREKVLQTLMITLT